ncbi:MAG: FAD-dependent oxidoreductase [Clostridia bacterium]|nr:FAD-dependent oxidoreductase [Clostridia bacterium]
MIYKRTLDTKYTVDVFVAGGGPAGVSAAIAAARQGKSVFLAESQGSFGGVAAAGLVPAFAPFDDGVNVLASGIGWELRKLVSRDVPLNSYWTPIKVEELKKAYDKMMTQSGVKFSFFTTVCDVVASGDHIDYVVLSAKSGLFAVKADVYVDCTGDGDLCAFGGGRYEKGDKDGNVMPSTLCSLWANIDFSRRTKGDSSMLEQAFADGVFTKHDRHLPGFFAVDSKNGIGGGNIGHAFGVDTTDETSLTGAMIYSRSLLEEYETYYRKYLPGYENMTLVYTGTMLGVRESRRIVCDYTLNVNDFISRAVFDDEIGRYCYPVDIHVMSTDKAEYERFLKEYQQDLHYKRGESYGIPYRSLIPVSFSNLLIAGRCIGTDRQMQASVRVMPGCFITGQAAGTAAALSCGCGGDVRGVKIPALHESLRKLGAYLPNAK